MLELMTRTLYFNAIARFRLLSKGTLQHLISDVSGGTQQVSKEQGAVGNTGQASRTVQPEHHQLCHQNVGQPFHFMLPALNAQVQPLHFALAGFWSLVFVWLKVRHF
jgi:hypothetical protein